MTSIQTQIKIQDDISLTNYPKTSFKKS